MVRIRPAVVEDAAAWAWIVQAASPLMVLDAESEAHEMRTEPADARRAVAAVDGVVVGVSRFRCYPYEEHAGLTVRVHPDRRRRGIGSALMVWAEPHLASSGRARVVTVVEDDDASRIASGRWGFAEVRRLRNAAVDPRTAQPPGAPPAGVQVVTVEHVGPRPIWEAHQRVARDDPSGLTLPMEYDDWRSEWDDPRSRHDLGHAALVDGALAAYSLLGTAGDRAWSQMTGTLPEHRGRGLAVLVKQHTLCAAAAAGVTRAMTGNDAANAPMLTVNRRLGYQQAASPTLAERPIPHR